MRNVFIFIIGIVILGGGSVVLQVFLSKNRNKWYGLMLPALTMLIALIAAVSTLAAALVFENKTIEQYDENGVLISSETVERSQNSGSVASVLLISAVTFFVCNIPTVIFLIVYYACREKYKNAAAMNKMNIQDLE